MSPRSLTPSIRDWVERYEPELLAVARNFETEYMTAEDILQEAWLVAMRKGGTLPQGSRPGAWLYQVVLNIGRAARRKASRRRALLATWGGQPKDPPHTSPSIGEELVRRRLWREISRLPEGQRRVLLLRLADGYEPVEIAVLLESTAGAVRARLARATKTIRDRMVRVHPIYPPFSSVADESLPQRSSAT